MFAYFFRSSSNYVFDYESEDQQFGEVLINNSGIKCSRYSKSVSLLCKDHSSNNNDVEAEFFSKNNFTSEQEVESTTNTEHQNIESRLQKRKVHRTVEKELTVRKRRRQPAKCFDNAAKTAK